MNIIIEEDQIDLYRLCLRYLLAGKSVYYSDNITSRLGDYNSTVDLIKIHEFGKKIYSFLNENSEKIKEILNIIGYNLNREELHTISSLPENKYFYYTEPQDLLEKVDSEKKKNLDDADIIIVSSLILETNGGALYIDYDNFVNNLVNEPQNTLKMEITFLKFASIINPRLRNVTEGQKTILKIKETIDRRMRKNLLPFNFIHIIQNNQKKKLISLGPSSFRLISLFRNKKLNYNKIDDKTNAEKFE